MCVLFERRCLCTTGVESIRAARLSSRVIDLSAVKLCGFKDSLRKKDIYLYMYTLLRFIYGRNAIVAQMMHCYLFSERGQKNVFIARQLRMMMKNDLII